MVSDFYQNFYCSLLMNVYNVPSVHKTSFPHHSVKTQAPPIWNFHHRYKYDIIQSTSQPRARIFFFNSFTRNVLFPDVCLHVLLSHYVQMSWLTVFLLRGFPDYEIKKYCLQVFTIALSLPEILL